MGGCPSIFCKASYKTTKAFTIESRTVLLFLLFFLKRVSKSIPNSTIMDGTSLKFTLILKNLIRAQILHLLLDSLVAF